MTASSAMTMRAIGLPTLPAPPTLRARKRDSKYYFVREQGRISRMDERSVVKLPYLDSSNDQRRRIHSSYEHAVSFDASLADRSSESLTAYLAVLCCDDWVPARKLLRYTCIRTEVQYPIGKNNGDFASNVPAYVTLPPDRARRAISFLECRVGLVTAVLNEGIHRPALTCDEQYRLFPDALRPETIFGPGNAHGAIERHDEFPMLSGSS